MNPLAVMGEELAKRLIATHGDRYAEALAELFGRLVAVGADGGDHESAVAVACYAWGHYLTHYMQREEQRKQGSDILTAILASRDPDPKTSN